MNPAAPEQRASWLLSPLPTARIAWLRILAYAFVPVDLLLNRWVFAHAHVPGELYRPLLIGRVLHLPTPGPWVTWFGLALIAGSMACLALAVRERVPAWAGYAVGLGWLWWQVIAFSYGKVDHDRLGFLVLLLVLPTVGRASRHDEGLSEAAGWAVRATALAVVATYTLSGLAKLRFGGLGWVDGATIVQAVIRRGTPLATPLLDHPWTLTAFQPFLLGVELFVAPLLLVRWRRRGVLTALVLGFLLFHVMTFAMLSIIFLPHCVALLCLLPFERLPLRAGVPA